MSSSLGKTVSACWRPLSQYVRMNRDDNSNRNINNEDASITMLGEEDDPSIWYKDLEKHFCGEFSFAAAQANRVMEDHGQVETGKNATFVGVYDGHGSHEAARFIGDNLFYHLIMKITNGHKLFNRYFTLFMDIRGHQEAALNLLCWLESVKPFQKLFGGWIHLHNCGLVVDPLC